MTDLTESVANAAQILIELVIDEAQIWCCCGCGRPGAAAPIQPLAWEPPHAAGAAQEIATTTTTKVKRQKKKKKKQKQTQRFHNQT